MQWKKAFHHKAPLLVISLSAKGIQDKAKEKIEIIDFPGESSFMFYIYQA